MSRLDRRSFLAALLSLPATQAMGQDASLFVRPPAKPVPGSSQLIARSGLAGSVGYALIDPDTGNRIDSGLGEVAMPPASTMKALTALYALDRLGLEFRFRTRIMRSGDMLILAGGGDPVLDTDGLAALADDLIAAGQSTPSRFVVWGGALPAIPEIAPIQADHLAYNPALSGMILNFNRVYLDWRPDSGGVQMSLQARAARHSPRAFTISAEARDQAGLFAYRSDATKEFWSVSRSAVRRAGSRWLPVRKPELYAGDVFQTLCRAKGLVLPTPEVIDELPEAQEIVAHDSPALDILLADMLEYSTNLTAEAIGLRASGAQDQRSSGAAMRDWFLEQGLGQDFLLLDHSGLSTQSRVTAVGMARAMGMAKGADALGRLMKRNPLDRDLGAQSSRNYTVHAKTGTLNFVSNLAGFIAADGGRKASFALLCTDQPRQVASVGQELPAGVSTWTRQAKQLQREILTGWSRGVLRSRA